MSHIIRILNETNPIYVNALTDITDVTTGSTKTTIVKIDGRIMRVKDKTISANDPSNLEWVSHVRNINQWAIIETYATTVNTKVAVVLTSDAIDPVSSVFDVIATFAQPMTSVTSSMFTVTNGTVTNLVSNADGTVFTATISPTIVGTVLVDFAVDQARDIYGNLNLVAVQFEIEFDNTLSGELAMNL